MESENRPKILWVSLLAPYDKVKHAGGKIENYFLKSLHKRNSVDIYMITFETKEVQTEMDLDSYGIKNHIFYYTWNGIAGMRMKIQNAIGKLNFYNRQAGLVSGFYAQNALKKMKQLKKEGFVPDIIIFQWTEIATMLEAVKQIFPQVKTVIIEEDVSFLGYERKADAASGIKKRFLKKKYKRIKKRELELLNRVDLIILNNYKDKQILEGKVSNTDKVWVWCPYYQSMLQYPRKRHNKDILFYGAISREENWKTVIWFIENVWCRIEDQEARFVIVGSNPPPILKKYESNRIIITGFVEDIKPYFETSLCLAAPLVLGAGVKIKVIEGLSAGIPVLTNGIGIEGIPAVDGQEYFFCETPEEYVEKINALLQDKIDTEMIEQNSKKFISENYNFEKDIKLFEAHLKSLLS